MIGSNWFWYHARISSNDRPCAQKAVDRQIWLQPIAIRGDYADHKYRECQIVGGVQPFFDIGDRYGALYAEMLALLERLDSKELDRRQERRDAVDMLPAGTLASLWLDIDTSDELSAASGDHGDAVDSHIRAIEDWLRVLEDEHLSEQQAIHSKLMLALTDRMPARLNTLALRCWRAAIKKVGDGGEKLSWSMAWTS